MNLAGSMPARCAIAAPAAAARVDISVVLAYAEFVFVSWRCRVRSLVSSRLHGIPSKNRKLKAGDIVSIDCGTVFEGWVADSAFTAGVGDISPKAQELLDVTEGSLKAGIEKMRIGNRTGDVSAAIQNYVESRGFHG